MFLARRPGKYKGKIALIQQENTNATKLDKELKLMPN